MTQTTSKVTTLSDLTTLAGRAQADLPALGRKLDEKEALALHVAWLEERHNKIFSNFVEMAEAVEVLTEQNKQLKAENAFLKEGIRRVVAKAEG